MKEKLYSPWCTRCFTLALLVAMGLFTASPRAAAQADRVTISAAEFKRMVYSAHLLTVLQEKPELDASLQVLLELQRRNPHANPASLAAVLQETTARYRTNAPAYIRDRGYRDEILAAYLENLRQVPARTSFVSANFSLLNYFMLQPADYAEPSSTVELIHAGNERLLTAEKALKQRQELTQTCTRRAYSTPAFGVAMDFLLWPEAGVHLANTPAEVLTLNPVLGNSPTMQSMLGNINSGDGSVSISTNDLRTLFTREMQVMHQIIETNLAVHLEILQTQTDLPSYLTNTALIAANVQRENEVKQGHKQRLAAANASIQAVSQIVAAEQPDVGELMSTIGNAMHTCSEAIDVVDASKDLLTAGATLGLVGVGLQLVNVFLDLPTPEDAIHEQITKVQSMVTDLSNNMNYRFDRVDLTLNHVLDRLDTSLGYIGEIGYQVDTVRQSLLAVQTDLHRLERQIFDTLNAGFRGDLFTAIGLNLGYELNHVPPRIMDSGGFEAAENTFHNWAVNVAKSPQSLPSFIASDLQDDNWVNTRLQDFDLEYNVHMLSKLLSSRFGAQSFGTLANPRDWFVGASAYLQLALENPTFLRGLNITNRLDEITASGRELTSFFRSLTFSGQNINWPLYNALLTNYAAKVNTFIAQMHQQEQEYADLHLDGFKVGTWRNWATSSPRITTTKSEVTPLPLYAQAAKRIAVGAEHSVALKGNGTVLCWGDNSFGQSSVPANATGVVAIAAGNTHTLALKEDNTVIGWGVTTVPPTATNVVAIAAGANHGLALKKDGTVVGWGNNDWGQASGAMAGGNVMAIAAGHSHSMALKSNGTVVAWGYDYTGATNVPNSLANVVAIAAGSSHSLALKSDGTVVGWGDNWWGQANGATAGGDVVAIAAGYEYSLALKVDGTVVGWGSGIYADGQFPKFGQAIIPTGLDNVIAIAAFRKHSLALKADGTVVAWGDNSKRQSAVPGSPPAGAVAIAAGDQHCLALRADGTVIGWGNSANGRNNGGLAGSQVVAISAAGGHNLALKADGTVVAWGDNSDDLATVPGGLNQVVAIAAAFRHNLVLRKDGTVAGWGRLDNNDIPSQGRNNVVGIAAGGYTAAFGTYVGRGQSLLANGTVVTWGDDNLTPAENANLVAIAAGTGHGLALKNDGSVRSWGNGGYAPAGLVNVVAIAGGGGHSVALKADGTVVDWGVNGYNHTAPSGLSNVVALAAAGYHDFWTAEEKDFSLALKADGTVVGWGNNEDGQLDIPASLRRYESSAQCLHDNLSASNVISPAFDAVLLNGTTWTTGIVPGADGSAGSAISLDGTNDYVLVPNFGNSVPTSEVTIEFWARVRRKTQDPAIFVLKPDVYADRFLVHAGRTDNRVFWDFGDAGGSGASCGRIFHTIDIALGEWQHFAFVASQSTTRMKIFYNGVEVASSNQFNPFERGTYDLILGQHFAGDLDELRIWSRALSQTEIAANMNNRLSGAEANLVAYWSFDDGPGPGITGLTKVVAGVDFSVGLRTNGTVVAWGSNERGECLAPFRLTGVRDISAGRYHGLALKTDGSVVAWGWNGYGQTDVTPFAGYDIVAIAAGGAHNLALKRDGTVLGCGWNAYGQSNPPTYLSSVVAIAAGGAHSLALKADGTVVGWGWNTYGQTNTEGLVDVVAIAAGENHSLALFADGTVHAFGWNAYGQTDVPPGLDSVVAIAAHKNHSLALKADGTVVAWGQNTYGQTNLPTGLNNVVALAAGGRHNVFLTAQNAPGANGGLTFTRAQIPTLIGNHYLHAVTSNLVHETASADLSGQAWQISGSKALLQAVLELGMPYTMERDDVLHGFFYGTERLTDQGVITNLFIAETNRLFSTPNARPMVLEDVVSARYNSFTNRLYQRLNDLAVTGQPETPRMVGHTLRLLDLLREAWAPVPPPALEVQREFNDKSLVLYGEPYAHYTLQYRDSLNVPGWTTTTLTNLHNEQFTTNTPALTPGANRFYRALLPAP